MKKRAEKKNTGICPYCGSNDLVAVYDEREKKRSILLRVILLPVSIPFFLVKATACLIFPPLEAVAFQPKYEEYLSHYHCDTCGYDF